MPAMLDDPSAATIYRVSGNAPFPSPQDFALPIDIVPHHVTLRDRITTATLLPFSSADQVPQSLLAYLCAQFAREIELGDTYPMMQPLTLAQFGAYWFQNFAAVTILGPVHSIHELGEMEACGNADWNAMCLGSFYVKPNYPGRSSHVCNGGFLVTDAARNRGVGRLMGEGYLQWAPKLGYSYSVFNLVYETNVASLRIWDSLGFKRIGRVPKCGNLRSYPDEYVDAIIYGRELGPEGEDFVSEERFEKIRFYLKQGKYPNGADRAEKSRLRSAATHYKLLPPLYPHNADGSAADERLMLKDKEVVSDPQRQYEIGRETHAEHAHSGINKTTAAIAERFHWVRIKETVSLVIKNCQDCKDQAKPQQQQQQQQQQQAHPRGADLFGAAAAGPANKRFGGDDMAQGIERLVHFDQMQAPAAAAAVARQHAAVGGGGGGSSSHAHDVVADYRHHHHHHHPYLAPPPPPPPSSAARPGPLSRTAGVVIPAAFHNLPLDPQILHGVPYDMAHIDNFLNLPRQAHDDGSHPGGDDGDGMHHLHPGEHVMSDGFAPEHATMEGGDGGGMGGEEDEDEDEDEEEGRKERGGRRTRAGRKGGEGGDRLMGGL